MDLLYMNLESLVKQANMSMAIQRQIFHHSLEIDKVIQNELPMSSKQNYTQ